jgi:hypothetical protein
VYETHHIKAIDYDMLCLPWLIKFDLAPGELNHISFAFGYSGRLTRAM